MVDVYFFGCWGSVGHSLYARTGRSIEEAGPFSLNNIDGKYAPQINPQDESISSLVWVDGWTIMGMWDRSVDKRGNSNAAFIAKGKLTQAEMWELANKHFPSITKRLQAFKALSSARN